MTVTPTETAANPSWWHHSGPAGEADAKEDVRASGAGSEAAPETESFGFFDLLDVINPLQHIPVVSTLYREITGDQIGATARTIGGALYGGPVGLVAALANNVAEAETGRDIGGHALAMVAGDAGAAAGTTGTTALADAGASGTRADPRQITIRPDPQPADPQPSDPPSARQGPVPPVPGLGGASGSPPAPGAISSPGRPLSTSPPTPPRTTEETIAAATATRVPRQELPSMSERAFDRLMRMAGAERATSVDTARHASLHIGGPPVQTDTAGGRESVQDWMMQALEKYERMKAGAPVPATGGDAG